MYETTRRERTRWRNGGRDQKEMGSLDEFKKAFQTFAVGNFGSGWTWLVKKADSSLDIVNMGAAGTPLTTGEKALLCVDVWEHAYYIDYRNQRPKFVETFLNILLNWDFVAKNSAWSVRGFWFLYRNPCWRRHFMHENVDPQHSFDKLCPRIIIGHSPAHV